MEKMTIPNTFKTLIRPTNTDQCERHPDQQMIETPGGIVCLSCQREKRDREDLEFGRRSLLSDRSRETVGVLESKSIIVDDTVSAASIENYRVEHPEHERILAEIKSIANDFVKGYRGNVWLVGDPGAGKSHAAMSILKAVNTFGKTKLQKAFDNDEPIHDKGFSCLFITIDEMFREIKNSFNDRESMFTEHYFVDLCSSVDLLVIDDLGAESGSMSRANEASNFTQTVLYGITNARQNKATIITTNLTTNQRAKKYDQKMLSRLRRGNREVVFVEMPDMRVKDKSEY